MFVRHDFKGVKNSISQFGRVDLNVRLKNHVLQI